MRKYIEKDVQNKILITKDAKIEKYWDVYVDLMLKRGNNEARVALETLLQNVESSVRQVDQQAAEKFNEVAEVLKPFKSDKEKSIFVDVPADRGVLSIDWTDASTIKESFKNAIMTWLYIGD